MKFLKNRTVLGVVCIALSLVICFAITPLFNAAKSSTTNAVRLKNDIKIGQQITEKDIEVVEVGSYNLPSEILGKSEDVVRKYAASEMKKNPSESEITEKADTKTEVKPNAESV